MWYLSATESGIRAYPESLHKYLYADSDPTNSYDPTGHEAFFEMAIRFAKVAFNVYNQISPALTGKSFGDCVKTAFNAELSDMNAALEG